MKYNEGNYVYCFRLPKCNPQRNIVMEFVRDQYRNNKTNSSSFDSLSITSN